MLGKLHCMAKAETVEEYIAAFPPDVQEVLETVRSTIRAAMPDTAGERISYAIPAFTVDGTVVVFYSGWKAHISMYPIPGGNDAFLKRITPHIAGKGTLQFPLDKPMPLKLITEITKARLQEHLEAQRAKQAKAAQAKTAKAAKKSG